MGNQNFVDAILAQSSLNFLVYAIMNGDLVTQILLDTGLLRFSS